MIGYFVTGIAFGILLESKGYNFLWAIAMSFFIYAGSMQFASIGLINLAFNPIQIIVLTLSVNARHIFYGLSLIDKYKVLGKRLPIAIHTLTDETYSLMCSVEAPEDVDKGTFYLTISLLNQMYWVISSAIGALIGSVININTKGIDFVMTALFVVIFLNQWEETDYHFPAIVGVLASIISLVLFGKSTFIIISMVAILTLNIWYGKKVKEL